MPLTRPMTDSARALPTIAVSEDGEIAGPRVYPLAVNGTLSNAASVRGGSYLWSAESSNWNGATATLQSLGQDLTTWRALRLGNADVALTANGSVEVKAGQGATLRVLLSGGTPTALYANLAGT